MTKQPVETTKFILLQSAQDCQCGCNWPGYRQKFFTTFVKDEDQTKLSTGEVAYEVIGYAASIEEAQRGLYNRSCDK